MILLEKMNFLFILYILQLFSIEMQAYFGENICCDFKKDKSKCTRKAYYKRLSDNEIVCGMHAKKDNRVELPRNPNEKINKENAINEHKLQCKKFAKENNNCGIVKCKKMKMFGGVELIDNYLNVFPNFKHGPRKDGLGMPSLSPKSIGSIIHGQPDLPICLNLENFHQGNKVFESEIDANGFIKKEFYSTQINMYNDTEPHRHKTICNKKNATVFSIWKDKKGVEHKINYFESRQFYCTFYERAVEHDENFIKLKNLIEKGYNLMIVGYDAYDVDASKNIEDYYKDTTKPFGHELVLYTMLVHKKEEWPWKKYKTFEY